MARAARGSAAGSGQIGDADVVSGHMKWSSTVDPSAVQGIPGVVSENSRPFFVVFEPLEAAGGLSPGATGTEGLLSPRQTEVLCFAAAGCTERETALRLGIASATVRGHLARARERLGARSTCQAVALAVALRMIAVECVS
jgi:DNA-binding CsgD family transcriptional regulator